MAYGQGHPPCHDVSSVDPEEVLVDYQTVEPGDVSGDLKDDNQIPDYGKEDKILGASIPKCINPLPQHAKSTLNTPPEFHFDEVL
ncbi:hypothetical protein BKA82DRAFT_4223685 [Pisolithus tinctorius]|nr:hypothetical protein BKA82DRAFT_4223685 [Pisolithus tinctorius]